MINALIVLLFFLVLVIVFLLFNNSKIKHKHAENLDRFQAIISSLHKKQKFLNTKIEISAEYKVDYLKDIRVIGNEIVELQKVFINVLSNENNK